MNGMVSSKRMERGMVKGFSDPKQIGKLSALVSSTMSCELITTTPFPQVICVSFPMRFAKTFLISAELVLQLASSQFQKSCSQSFDKF